MKTMPAVQVAVKVLLVYPAIIGRSAALDKCLSVSGYLFAYRRRLSYGFNCISVAKR